MVTFEFPSKEVLHRLRNQQNKFEENTLLWPNIFVNASTSNFQKKIHESSLSLLCNFKGEAICKINRRNLKICTDTFLLVNCYETFEYEITTNRLTETSNLHFNYSFLQEILSLHTTSNELLLENCNTSTEIPVFKTQLNYKDDSFKALLTVPCFINKEVAENNLALILLKLIEQQKNLRLILENINAIKHSVRQELFRRVTLAKDYIYSNYNNNFSMDLLAKEVGMSKFHFLRTFKSVYGISAYQLLKMVRMERAKTLLKETEFPPTVISVLVGFEEPNSFFQAFKNYTDFTPTSWRISNIK